MADSTETKQDGTQRRSFFSRYFWLLFLLVAVVLLPSLLTVTGQQHSVIGFVHPKLSKAIEFESATTHWWAPVVINDVRLKDLSVPRTEGIDPVPALTATSVTTSQPLWKIALSMGSGAEVTVVQPVVNVRVQNGQTNVEQTLASILGSDDSKSGGAATPVSVTIQNGIVRLLSESPTGTHPSPLFTTISNINGTFSTLDQSLMMPSVMMIADVGNPISIVQSQNQAAAAVQQGVNPRIAATLDQLSADHPLVPFTDTEMAVLQTDEAEPSLKMQISPDPDRPNVQNMVVEARRLNLKELEPIIQRLLPGTVCVGNVSCRLQAYLLEDGNDDGFAGRLSLLAEDVRWRNAAWAVGESIDLESVTAQGAVALAADGLMVNGLQVRSALLDLEGSGEVKLQQAVPIPTAVAEGDSQQTIAGAESGQVNLSGRIDVARLTKMLPSTLNVADGVTADSGDLRFSFRVRPPEPSMSSGDSAVAANDVFAKKTTGLQWRLAAESSPIRAKRNGRSIVIDSSLRLDAVGGLSSHSADLTRARVAGAFGEITADPIQDGFLVGGRVNPDRLWQDVRQLIDIPRPGLTSDLNIDGEIRSSATAIQLSSFSLSSQEIAVKTPSLTVFPSAPLVRMFDGTVTVDGAAPALKTLIAPWHSATWLADRSTVSARLGRQPEAAHYCAGRHSS